MTHIADALAALSAEKNLNSLALSAFLDCSMGYLQKVMEREKPVSVKMLDALFTRFPELDQIEWRVMALFSGTVSAPVLDLSRYLLAIPEDRRSEAEKLLSGVLRLSQ